MRTRGQQCGACAPPRIAAEGVARPLARRFGTRRWVWPRCRRWRTPKRCTLDRGNHVVRISEGHLSGLDNPPVNASEILSTGRNRLNETQGFLPEAPLKLEASVVGLGGHDHQ